MFDNFMILNKGKINYFGKASDAEAYYGDLGYKLPPNKNPIDYYIEISIKADLEK